MKNKFKISIIVNCFNGEKFLEKCLNSILNQTFQNWELIFYDNYSTDNTKNIFKKFKDERFKYYCSESFLKLYEARNRAISKVDGDFIAFLDCDDWWETNHLESAHHFCIDKSYYFFFSNAYNYIENKKKYFLHKKKLPHGDVFNSLLIDYSVKISSLIIRKVYLDKHFKKVFNSNFNIIGDFDLVMRMSSLGKAFSNNNPTVNCSFHGQNYSLLNRDEFATETKYWFDQIDFTNSKFLENKKLILDNVNYIVLFNNIIKEKTLKNLFDELKINNVYKKLKLLIIFFVPKAIIKKMLNKYK